MKKLQVISFNVPYPPDYGGAIDVFYKLKALKEAGIAVTLHCFDYGRGKSPELEQLCRKVFYYPRSKSFVHQFSKLPFIVKTRNTSTLIKNLNQHIEIPVLAEGLHSTFPLYSEKCSNKNIYVRTHNIEHAYYYGLYKSESHFIKKMYFLLESKKLKQYEPVLKNAKGICSISPNEKEYFSQLNTNTILLTPFHPFHKVEIKEGFGNYILIHGDLSVSENIHSVLWLIDNVLSKINYPVIIAGKSPNKSIGLQINKHNHIHLIPNPSFDKMQELISNAHIHIVHSFTPQGMKLKLLNILHNGRHCISNSLIIQNTGLEILCEIADTEYEIISTINKLMKIPFEKQKTELRKEVLSLFSNSVQTEKLIRFLNLI